MGYSHSLYSSFMNLSSWNGILEATIPSASPHGWCHTDCRGLETKEQTHLLCFALQFEMLTGSLPFQGKDRKETMALILK